MAVAKRRAIDRIRRNVRLERKIVEASAASCKRASTDDLDAAIEEVERIDDDVLRLRSSSPVIRCLATPRRGSR